MPYEGDLQEAYTYCDRIARQRARNFYPAFRFLSRQRRLALSAFYVFCSYSDDIADDEANASLEEKQAKLEAWKTRLDGCFTGGAEAPLFIALQDTIRRFELPREPFFDLLRGIEMDFIPQRFQNFDDLKAYCRCVASSVGLVSVRIFGCTHPGADRYANLLGIGLQLTNIMRDLAEDISRGRVYIPTEDLDRFAYSEKDLTNGVMNENFLNLMEYQHQRASGYFRDAQPGLAAEQRGRLLAAEMMKSAYRQILESMRARSFNVFDGRINVPRWRLIATLAATFLRHLVR